MCPSPRVLHSPLPPQSPTLPCPALAAAPVKRGALHSRLHGPRVAGRSLISLFNGCTPAAIRCGRFTGAFQQRCGPSLQSKHTNEPLCSSLSCPSSSSVLALCPCRAAQMGAHYTRLRPEARAMASMQEAVAGAVGGWRCGGHLLQAACL